MHIDLHTTLSVNKCFRCQLRRSGVIEKNSHGPAHRPGARHWQPAINTNDCSLRSRWHPRHHPCNTPAHTYERLPPAPSLSFLHNLSLWFLPQFVTTVTPLTGKPVIASEIHVPSANTLIRARTHLRSCFHAERGDETFLRVEQWLLRNLRAHFPRIHYSDSVSIFNPENHFVFNFN